MVRKELEKEQVGAGINQDLGLGPTKFELFIRHPNGEGK